TVAAPVPPQPVRSTPVNVRASGEHVAAAAAYTVGLLAVVSCQAPPRLPQFKSRPSPARPGLQVPSGPLYFQLGPGATQEGGGRPSQAPPPVTVACSRAGSATPGQHAVSRPQSVPHGARGGCTSW